MTLFKDYIAQQLIGKKVHLVGHCVIHLDVTGRIISYSINNNEIIYKIQMGNGKVISIGENHPNLEVEAL